MTREKSKQVKTRTCQDCGVTFVVQSRCRSRFCPECAAIEARENLLTLTYEALLAYPTVTELVLLICPGFFVDNAQWTGVPVATLLAQAGIKRDARRVAFHALDGYMQILRLEVVQKESVFLAHTVNGQVLPAEHGYPLRLVVKGEYGSKWVKWVERIEVM